MSTASHEFTALQFLRPRSVTTFHILLPDARTWLALNSQRDRDSFLPNLSPGGFRLKNIVHEIETTARLINQNEA